MAARMNVASVYGDLDRGASSTTTDCFAAQQADQQQRRQDSTAASDNKDYQYDHLLSCQWLNIRSVQPMFLPAWAGNAAGKSAPYTMLTIQGIHSSSPVAQPARKHTRHAVQVGRARITASWAYSLPHPTQKR